MVVLARYDGEGDRHFREEGTAVPYAGGVLLRLGLLLGCEVRLGLEVETYVGGALRQQPAGPCIARPRRSRIRRVPSTVRRCRRGRRA